MPVLSPVNHVTRVPVLQGGLSINARHAKPGSTLPSFLGLSVSLNVRDVIVASPESTAPPDLLSVWNARLVKLRTLNLLPVLPVELDSLVARVLPLVRLVRLVNSLDRDVSSLP
jgi:hypothetical protein